MGKFAAVHMTPTNVTLAEHPVRRRPGQSRRRALWTGTTALALVAVLAACTGDTPAPPSASATATATSAPTASAAPTPSATPTPTSLPSASDDFSSIDLTVPPPRPDALDAPPSKEAAADVATYFALLFSYSAVTHDLRAFDDLSHPECGFCSDFIDEIRGYEAQGVTTEGGAIVVQRADARMQSDDYFIVTTTMSQDSSRELDADGEVTGKNAGFAAKTFEIDVTWYHGSWLVASVVPT